MVSGIMGIHGDPVAGHPDRRIIGVVEDMNSTTKTLIAERYPSCQPFYLKARNFAELLQERMATHHRTIDSLAPTNAGCRRYKNLYRRFKKSVFSSWPCFRSHAFTNKERMRCSAPTLLSLPQIRSLSQFASKTFRHLRQEVNVLFLRAATPLVSGELHALA